MADAIVVLNAGSSSIKFSLFLARGAELALDVRGQIEGLYTAPRFVAKGRDGAQRSEKSWPPGTKLGHDAALRHLLDFLQTELADDRLVGVGHRVVHGALDFREPVRMDAAAIAQLEKLVPLAPLHQPHNLTPIRAIAARMPALPQIACFDTAFHQSAPALAQAFALPPEITDRGVRRYGFHGLSYEYIADAMRAVDAKAAAGRMVVAHLGNGASMCAIAGGRSVASTMGFTALDGLVMGTRPGNVDPGVLIWLMDEMGMGPRDLEALLYHRSGLLGVSGVSSDMRTLLASGEPRAKLAVDLFCYRIGRELGSLVAALGGIDALVFTGGIGEHAAPVRAAVVRGARWLGLELDEAANAAGVSKISVSGSHVSAYVVPTDEELMIARHVQAAVAGPRGT